MQCIDYRLQKSNTCEFSDPFCYTEILIFHVAFNLFPDYHNQLQHLVVPYADMEIAQKELHWLVMSNSSPKIRVFLANSNKGFVEPVVYAIVR